jgi:membrane protein
LSTAADRAADADVGHIPSGPHRLSAHEWRAVVKRTAKQFLQDDCMGLSQQVAFSSLLAFFPSVILLVGLLGLIGAYEDLKTFLGTVAPGAVIDAIDLAQETAAGNKATSTVAVVIGLFGAIWAASGAMTAVIKALNVAYDRQETRPFWKVRLYALVLVFAIGLTFAGLFLLIVFGGPLGDAIARQAHLGGAWEWTWNILRWPIAFCGVLLFFSLVYYIGPNVDQRSWKWITPGSLVGAILWLTLSGLFSLYTSFSSSYDKTYGSLAGGIILLLWLNYSAMALLFGAELNAELDRQADIHASGGSRAGLIGYARRNR